MRADQVTVIVSTTNRPAMLRTALASIAAQTAADRIGRVVVSENAGAQASGAVAAEFKGKLPVDFFLRTPPLAALTHALTLTDELPETGLVAILHDDDWWSPSHLAQSLARLAAHPAGAVSYSSFFEVTGESTLLKSDSNLMFWFGTGFPAMSEYWVIDELDATISCLLGTPGRYSTLLAPIAHYRRAAAIAFREGNTFDNDRRLLLELARFGPIVFGPTPAVFIRTHSLQDSATFTTAAQIGHLTQSTHHLLDRCIEKRIDVRAEISRRLELCPADSRPALLAALGRAYCAGPLIERQMAPPDLTSYLEGLTVRPNLGYYLGQCIPPALSALLARIRGKS